jgi:hypothetical protein
VQLKVSILISASCAGWTSRCHGSYHGFDFQRAIAWYHHQQGPRRRDNAADRMDRELLHYAVDGSG